MYSSLYNHFLGSSIGEDKSPQPPNISFKSVLTPSSLQNTGSVAPGPTAKSPGLTAKSPGLTAKSPGPRHKTQSVDGPAHHRRCRDALPRQPARVRPAPIRRDQRSDRPCARDQLYVQRLLNDPAVCEALARYNTSDKQPLASSKPSTSTSCCSVLNDPAVCDALSRYESSPVGAERRRLSTSSSGLDVEPAASTASTSPAAKRAKSETEESETLSSGLPTKRSSGHSEFPPPGEYGEPLTKQSAPMELSTGGGSTPPDSLSNASWTRSTPPGYEPLIKVVVVQQQFDKARIRGRPRKNSGVESLAKPSATGARKVVTPSKKIATPRKKTATPTRKLVSPRRKAAMLTENVLVAAKQGEDSTEMIANAGSSIPSIHNYANISPAYDVVTPSRGDLNMKRMDIASTSLFDANDSVSTTKNVAVATRKPATPTQRKAVPASSSSSAKMSATPNKKTPTPKPRVSAKKDARAIKKTPGSPRPKRVYKKRTPSGKSTSKASKKSLQMMLPMTTAQPIASQGVPASSHIKSSGSLMRDECFINLYNM